MHRRHACALLLATAFAGSALPAARAAEAVTLFKVVTVKDEIVIGLTKAELAALGGEDAGAIGRALKAKGELTAWRFAVRKAKDGALEQAPSAKVSLLAHDSVRIEPYKAALRVVPIE